MIRAIIFDCFGVLVGRGFDETYRLAGGDPVKDHTFIEDLLGQANLGLISSTEFHQVLTSRLGISLEEYTVAVSQAEQPNIQLLEYIEKLRPRFRTAVLSNANVGVVERRVGEEWIKRCFDTMVVSAEVGIVKPDARIYELAAEKLGVKPSGCVFVDDREGYCAAARELGMQAIWYKDFAQFRAELEELLTESGEA